MTLPLLPTRPAPVTIDPQGLDYAAWPTTPTAPLDYGNRPIWAITRRPVGNPPLGTRVPLAAWQPTIPPGLTFANPGDLVRMSPAYLASVGVAAGPMADAVGTMRGVSPAGVAVVDWHGAPLPRQVTATNLVRAWRGGEPPVAPSPNPARWRPRPLPLGVTREPVRDDTPCDVCGCPLYRGEHAYYDDEAVAWYCSRACAEAARGRRNPGYAPQSGYVGRAAWWLEWDDELRLWRWYAVRGTEMGDPVSARLFGRESTRAAAAQRAREAAAGLDLWRTGENAGRPRRNPDVYPSPLAEDVAIALSESHAATPAQVASVVDRALAASALAANPPRRWNGLSHAERRRLLRGIYGAHGRAYRGGWPADPWVTTQDRTGRTTNVHLLHASDAELIALATASTPIASRMVRNPRRSVRRRSKGARRR